MDDGLMHGAPVDAAAPAAVGHESLLGAAGGLACLATHRLLVRIPLPPLPPLTGRTFVVTGSSAGLGLATAEQLLESGATVIFACRSEARYIIIL